MGRTLLKNHIHKFKLVKHRNGFNVYFCTLDDCRIKFVSEMALGKTSRCWVCDKPFTMTEKSLRLVKPHCENCTSRGKRIESTLSTMGNLHPDMPTPRQTGVVNDISTPEENITTSLRDRLSKSIERLSEASSDRAEKKDDGDML